MTDQETINRVAENLYSSEIYEAHEVYTKAKTAVDKTLTEHDYFSVICVIATVYKLGIENGKRLERSRRHRH